MSKPLYVEVIAALSDSGALLASLPESVQAQPGLLCSFCRLRKEPCCPHQGEEPPNSPATRVGDCDFYEMDTTNLDAATEQLQNLKGE